MNKFYALVLIFSYLLQAQTNPVVVGPGGISGTVLWMKTVPNTKNLHGQYKWQDFSGDSLRVNYYDNKGSAYGNEYIVNRDPYVRSYNFNPALSLNWSDFREASKEILVKKSNLSTATIIGAMAAKGPLFEQPAYIMAINGATGKGVILNTDKIINSKESNRGILDYGSLQGYDLMYHKGQSPEATLDKYKERTLRSFVYYRTNIPVTSVWGEKQKATLSLGQKFYSFNVNNTSAFDISSIDGSIFESFMPELFIYDRLLTPLERIKAESYLALKYGFMLERSFLGSSGQLLWDIDQNKKHNNRVTAIYRDDKSGLYQRSGTTSYEEAPYFSYSVSGDSHENGNAYGLANRYRLLVMERFPSNTMEDQGYTIWGDNAESIQTGKMEEYLGMKIMNRKWLVNTNMGGKLPTPEEMKWKIKDFDYTQEGYKIIVKKTSNSTVQYGSIVSENPLKGYEGHISFSIESLSGLMSVKFGTEDPKINKEGDHDYGICINDKGETYPIIRGKIQWDKKWSLIVKIGDRIRINKTEEAFIISLNGNSANQSGQPLPQIPINADDVNKSFYVSAQMELGIIKDFRVGGFIDTGNRIELSYADQRANDFSDYKDGKAYLIVDRSGTGEFKKETTDYYLSDEYDAYRKKIVFNNVFFDTDSNRKDVFTFGYRETNIIADVEKENPSCDNTGAALSNGKINIKIRRGDEGFEYELKNKATSKVEASGVFFGKNLNIDKLSSGNYTLKLKEIGGFTMISDSTGVESKGDSHQYIYQLTKGEQFQSVFKFIDQNYQMGLHPQSSGIATAVIRGGFEINKGQIYLIENYVKRTTPVPNIQLKPGDKLQIYNNDYGQVQYGVNGEVFYSVGLDTHYFFMIKLNNNAGGAYHIKNSGGTYVNWNSQGVKRIPLSETSLEHPITLISSCNNSTADYPPLVKLDKEKTGLILYYRNFSDKSEITARISLKEPSPISLAVFNLSGIQVYNKNIMESRKEHTVDLKDLLKGVYVVKAFTSEGEFTKKVIIK